MMRNRGALWIGVVLVAAGVVYLAAILLDIELRGSIWALALIALGVLLLLRPSGAGGTSDFRIIGDVVQRGRWSVSSREFWAFIGDMKLDLTEAEIPEGETVIRLNALIGDIKVVAPQSTALALSATGLILDVRLFGEKHDGFLTPVDLRTPGYESAPRRVRLEATGFITGVKVRTG